MEEVVLSGAILVIGIPGELVKPVESVSELDNASTAVADGGLVLLGSMGPEDGVSLIIILGTVLRETETVGDGSMEEVADTEVKMVIVVKLLLILCEETDEDMVTSGAFLEVEMVTGEVNEASLCGNGIDDNCPVVEDAGGKTVVSDWSDVMKPDEDRLPIVVVGDRTTWVTSDMLPPPIDKLLRLLTIVTGNGAPSDASTSPTVNKSPLPSDVLVSSPNTSVG